MAISKVIYGNNTLIDISNDTVVANKLANGYTAHDAAGNAITGTGSITTMNPGISRLNDMASTLPYIINFEAYSNTLYQYMKNQLYFNTSQNSACDTINCVVGESIDLYITSTDGKIASIFNHYGNYYFYNSSSYPNIEFSHVAATIYYAIVDYNDIVLAKGTVNSTVSGTTIALPSGINTQNGIAIKCLSSNAVADYLTVVPTA